MKIYPDLPKIWAKRIKDAGMTSKQAQKVLEEADKTQKLSESFAQSGGKMKTEEIVKQLMKKINIF